MRIFSRFDKGVRRWIAAMLMLAAAASMAFAAQTNGAAKEQDSIGLSSTAQTIEYTDSFSFMAESEGYVRLYEAINNCMASDEVESRYAELKSSLGTTAQDWMILMKASINCAHYHLEVAPKKNSKRAKELISYAYDIYEALEKAGVDEDLLSPLYFCCLTMDYLAHPLSISKGLESVSVIDDAYERNPTELAVANLYAARRLNAPAIGGGDAELAFGIYTSLLEFIESKADSLEVAPWERFDAYSGIAKCYAKRNDRKNAVLYYEKALEIYPGNVAVIEALEDASK